MMSIGNVTIYSTRIMQCNPLQRLLLLVGTNLVVSTVQIYFG